MEKENYQYFIKSYSSVNEYLADIPTEDDRLPEIIVSFCVVIEKLFKIQLYKKNPILIYENTKIREDDALSAIIKKKELNIETIKVKQALSRYQLIFNDVFSENEIQVIQDIYDYRNHFLHSHKPDQDIISDKEKIIRKMGTVRGKISIQVQSILGKDIVKLDKKPKERYSERELENILIEEVRKKIKDTSNDYTFPHIRISTGLADLSVYDINGEKCPRCGNYGFSTEDKNRLNILTSDILRTRYFSDQGNSDLYKCSSCHLELTKKEYEIAKKINEESHKFTKGSFR